MVIDGNYIQSLGNNSQLNRVALKTIKCSVTFPSVWSDSSEELILKCILLSEKIGLGTRRGIYIFAVTQWYLFDSFYP